VMTARRSALLSVVVWLVLDCCAITP